MKHYWIVFVMMLLLCDMCHTDKELDDDEEEANVETVNEDDLGMNIQYAGNGDTQNLFKPTKEWQRVQPGQPITKGLHIRYNLQTGYTEAKLLDDAEEEASVTTETSDSSTTSKSLLNVDQNEAPEVPEDTTRGPKQRHMRSVLEQAVRDMEAEQKSSQAESLRYWKDGKKEGMLNTQGKTFSTSELKDALKKFKANQDDVSNAEVKNEDVRGKFRSYEELKNDMEEMEMGVKTETQILQELMIKYRDTSISVEEKVELLSEFEYYLHQIDNAQNFVEMGGLPLLLQDLNSTAESLRNEAAVVLGSATQSNPQVQVKCMEAGFLPKLIRMLATEPSESVQGRILFATSTLLRHFPFAQQKFLSQGGLHTLTQILVSSKSEKLKIKTITLITDLLTEQKSALENIDSSDPSHAAKIDQYKMLPFRELLKEQGWCSLIPTHLEAPEHDTQEKVLTAMRVLLDSCKEEFSQTNSRTLLSKLRQELAVLSQEEISSNDDDEYFRILLKNVDSLLSELMIRDEL